MAAKILIIGLDGATFTLLKPLMDQGLMPTLKNIMEKGVSGELRSTIPPITGPAWSSFMTGLNPGEHGIYDFLIRDEKTGNDIPINARLRHGKAFWEYLSAAGKKVIVLNVPVTYPPTPVNGVMVSDFLTPSGKRDFIYPPELVDELEDKFGKYPLYFRMPIASPGLSDANTISFLNELNGIMEYKFQAAHYLYDKFAGDFVMLHIWGTDRIQHELWNFFDESHSQFKKRKKEKFYDQILNYYKKLDHQICCLIEHVGEDSNLFIVSDHGFGPINWMIDLNQWLLSHGYITIKKNLSSRIRYAMWRKGLTFELVFRIFVQRMLKYTWKLWDTTPEKFIRSLPQRSIKFLLGINDIDWNHTKAFATYYGGIYINRKGVHPNGCVASESEAASLCKSIVAELKQLSNPMTGELIDGDIFQREDTFHGPYARNCPDIVYLPMNKKYLAGSFMGFGSNKIIVDSVTLPGNHTLMGILMAKGPCIQTTKSIAGATLLDMAPTILYLMGHKIPENMTGRVLKELFTPEFLAKNPVEYMVPEKVQKEDDILSAEEQKDVVDKLKGLGYL